MTTSLSPRGKTLGFDLLVQIKRGLKEQDASWSYYSSCPDSASMILRDTGILRGYNEEGRRRSTSVSMHLDRKILCRTGHPNILSACGQIPEGVPSASDLSPKTKSPGELEDSRLLPCIATPRKAKDILPVTRKQLAPGKGPPHCFQLFTQGLGEHLLCVEVTPHTQKRCEWNAIKLGTHGNVKCALQLQAPGPQPLKPFNRDFNTPLASKSRHLAPSFHTQHRPKPR